MHVCFYPSFLFFYVGITVCPSLEYRNIRLHCSGEWEDEQGFGIIRLVKWVMGEYVDDKNVHFQSINFSEMSRHV